MLIRRSSGPAKHGANPGGGGHAQIDLAQVADFQIATLTVRPSTLQVHYKGTDATIEPRAMQGLVALARSEGAVVSRDRLVNQCWAGRAVSEDAINRCIAKVRRVGGESGAFEIETIPRVGYRLRALQRRAHGAPIGLSRRFLVIATLTAAALLFPIVGLFFHRPGAEVPRPKIAVLGFTSLDSGYEAQQYADSITTGVSGALVQVGADLLMAPRPTIESARKAGASFLISGSVRRDADSIHVTTRIDSAGNGEALLSRDFDVSSNQSSFAHDQVAAWVADTVNSWSWILRWERDPYRVAALMQTQEQKDKYSLLRHLAKSAPNSGTVQAAFAGLVPFLLSEMPEADRQEAILAARMAARRAQRLLPRSGDAFALDCGLYPPGQYIFTSACEERMRKALELDPDAYFVPFGYAAELTEVDRFRDAAPLSSEALAAAPYNEARTALQLQVLWTLPPEYDSQLELQRRSALAHREWPSPNLVDQVRYQMFLNSGAMDKAEAMLNDSGMAPMIETRADGPAHLIFRAIHSHKLQDIRAANAACTPVFMPPDLVFGTCFTGLAALGDLNGVFRLAERGYDDRLCCSAAQVEQKWLSSGGQVYPRQYLFGPVMAKVRADRRFIDIARRSGLLAYWKSGHPPDFCETERAPVCNLLSPKPVTGR